MLWEVKNVEKGGEVKMPEVSINYIAVLVAAVATMVIGSVYYAPPVLGRAWMKLVGKNADDVRKGMWMSMFWMFVAALVESFILAHFVGYTNAGTWMDGAVTGFWLWIGFVVTTMFADYNYAGKSKKLYLIQIGYHLISLLVMGGILAVWV